MSGSSARPRLVYDGDCRFCRYTVGYAQSLTGDAVEYAPFQAVAAEHPDIDAAEFRATIILLKDGLRFAGARAAFEVLALGGRRMWIRLYLHTPLFAACAERAYRWTSRHRALAYRALRPLFGRTLAHRELRVTGALVRRGIFLCGLAAFVSLWYQIDALVGPGGISPAARFLEQVAGVLGAERYWRLPTLLWLDASSAALHVICAAGTLACIVGVTGRLGATAASAAYVCYLSLVNAGQIFTAYQWDVLLVECFAAAAIAARLPALGTWLFRLLVFRFMLLSGAVKLLSGDPTWADGTALAYHFETQPLPSPLAWHAHHLSQGVLSAGVTATLLIELVLPVFIFLPRNLRLAAAAGFMLLELAILATGSYNFFNLLTIVLCLALLDDGLVARRRPVPPSPRRRPAAAVGAALVIALGLLHVVAGLTRTTLPGALAGLRPFMLANPYGLFAVMTTSRHELVVEGTRDGATWLTYGFPFKPGDPGGPLRWATPHQPRLDWQMWFAVLRGPEQAPWIYDFVHALLTANASVLRHLDDPFAGARPAAVRILRYRYRFAPPAQRAADGAVWIRDEPTIWLPPARLRRPVITHEPLELE